MIQQIMKRYFLMVLLLMTALPLMAWEKKERPADSPYKHEFNVAWGMMPGNEAFGYYSYFTNYEGGLDNIYGNYMDDCITSGVISADYNIQFKRWFALGTQINGSVTSHTEMSSITGKEVAGYKSFAVSALAYARITYMNREYVKIYSAFGLGVRYSQHGDPSEIHYSFPTSGFETAYQIVPYGITIGKKIYGMLECCVGSETSGLRFGVGYRF